MKRADFEQALGTAIDHSAYVAETTVNKIRSFLYEWALGTKNYRSLHSLTEQVEHQYHGRFAIELIQNAHDALLLTSGDLSVPRRIEFCLSGDGEFGTLYIANDGHPFSVSNFESVSQLGQSDKSPEDSIGNKGIGFRSVLEITSCPAIWSRKDASSRAFDGFCFVFRPDFITSLAEPLLALCIDTADVPPSLLNGPIVDWNEDLLTQFRVGVKRSAEKAGQGLDDWIRQELRFLSPYLLPVPAFQSDQTAKVRDYEARGFASLIALALKDDQARQVVRETLSEIGPEALLFLGRADSLVLDDGEQRRAYSRHAEPRPNTVMEGREVVITEGDPAKEEDDPAKESLHYWLWSRRLSVEDAEPSVQAAIAGLPGKWPELKEVEISIAVPLGDEPRPGALSIFLPTMLSTGAVIRINAPFYGDMSRTQINFGKLGEQALGDALYNNFLLFETGQLALNVIQKDLVGRAATEACAVIDLIAPAGDEHIAVKRWQATLARAAEAADVDLVSAHWLLTDQGWRAVKEASVLPEFDAPRVLSQSILRQHACFPAYVEQLDARRQQIMAMSAVHGIDPNPLPDDWATTLEGIAQTLLEREDADWADFWSDVEESLSDDFSPLVGKRILLGTDNQLHCGGVPSSAVYFQPRQGVPGEDDATIEGEVDNVPSSLRGLIAVLNPIIPIYEEKSGRLHLTRLRQRLFDAKLVNTFRRENILSDVLVENCPQLPLGLDAPDAAFCRDLLVYGLRLVASMPERGTGERSIRALGKLPAPCKGGWYPLAETSFGPGWVGTNGKRVDTYLRQARTGTATEARNRLLLPPENSNWAGLGELHKNLMRGAGVRDGLRLFVIQPTTWASSFSANKGNFLIPDTDVPGLSRESWTNFIDGARNNANPKYNRGSYEVREIWSVPGLGQYRDFDDLSRSNFMEVVLGSAPDWGTEWKSVSINRTVGSSDLLELPSPMQLELESLDWLGFKEDDEWKWYRPQDRWHVPVHNLTRGRQWHFEHLGPLPIELAERLDRNPALSKFLSELGMPRYDADTPGPSPRLLNDLVRAAENHLYRNRDIFLGQVRSAWAVFDPGISPEFPRKLLVQRGDGALSPEVPDSENPVFLPDARASVAALRRFSLPLIAIEPKDASRLAEAFLEAFPGAVLSSASLRPLPLVGGEIWEGEALERLHEFSDLEWAIPLVLTIAAFHGPNSRGTSATGFKSLLDRFRSARVSVVENLSTQLFREHQAISESQSITALWLEERTTLLLDRTWQEQTATLADAFTQIIERQDLKYAIRQTFNNTKADPADEMTLETALEQLDLTLEHYREALEHWRGDIGPAVERLSRVLWLISLQSHVSDLSRATSETQVADVLAQVFPDGHMATTLMSLAREARDVLDFGRRIVAVLGPRVELSEWNNDLARAGEPQFSNPRAVQEFHAQLQVAGVALRRLFAKLAERQPSGPRFPDVLESLEGLTCPTELMTQFWEVGFRAALSVVVPMLNVHGATAEELSAVGEAESAPDLADRLKRLGMLIDRDPLEVAQENRGNLEIARHEIQQIALAWHEAKGQSTQIDWLAQFDPGAVAEIAEVEHSIYTRVWSPKEILILLSRALGDHAPAALRDSMQGSDSLESLISSLGLTADAVQTAGQKLGSMEQEAARRRRMVSVCGQEFENSEENITSLWTHITGNLPTEDMATLGNIELKKPAIPKKLSTSPARKPTGEKKPPVPPIKRLSKGMEKLVGNAGEIHAFRKLQLQFGATVVSPSSWVSGSSLNFYPDNGPHVDEGRGCDFVFAHEGRTYHIEVKASQGDITAFTLGSSEIRLAMELARSSRRRAREIFLILRVNDALSETPSFAVLPNPYDPRYQAHFKIEEAGVRIRYWP